MICAGHGMCTPGGCVCDAYWQNSTAGVCDNCEPGKFGPTCSGNCPTTCGQGICSDGIAGNGKCACTGGGYYGKSCTAECPGGAANPCSGHGVCQQLSGKCTCQANAGGHFVGTKCDRCDRFWNSAFCNVSCPTQGGVICNGRGTCSEGKCERCRPLAGDTSANYCGAACHQSGVSCLSFTTICPAGFWGFGCVKVCPAAAADGTGACTNHGVCNTDTGSCVCNAGYDGLDCSSACGTVLVGTHRVTCAGNGACKNDRCVCLFGYWGDLCDKTCPGGANNPCSDRGTCNVTTGACQCDTGIAGESCQIECQGSKETPCSNHGQCSVTDGSCACDVRFAGDACEACSYGFGGGDCTVRCADQFASTGYDCTCGDHHGGVDCSLRCPGIGSDAGVCSDAGACQSGVSSDGTCTCNTNYYDADCSVLCSPAGCLAEPHGMVNTQCTFNGTCECRSNNVEKWTGAKCDECQHSYWGQLCNLQCPCNGRGSCDKETGVCYCNQDAVIGFWTGRTCSECSSGYVGTSCRVKNIEMSSNDARSTRHSVEIRSIHDPSVMYRDHERGLTYVGNAPIIVYQASATGAPTVVASIAAMPVVVRALRKLNATHLVAVGFSQSSRTFVVPRFNNASLGAGDPVNATEVARASLSAAATQSVVRRAAAALAVTYSATATVRDDQRSIEVATLSSVGAAASVTLNLTDFTSNITRCDVHGDMIIVAGARGTASSPSWLVQTLSVAAVAAGSAATQSYSSDNINITTCVQTAPATRCLEALRCMPNATTASGTVGTMYCVIAQEAVVHVARFPFDLSASVAADASVTAATGLSTRTGHEARFVTAMAFDAVLGLGFVAMNKAGTKSFVYKFQMRDTALTGIYGVYAAYSLVQAMSVSSATRELVMVVHLQFSISIVSMNIFGVKDIQPAIIDSVGGTTVTVTGEGFAAFDTSTCVFGGVPTGAEFVDSTTLKCPAPSSSGIAASGACVSVDFNVAFGNRYTATTNVGFSRPASATLKVATALGYAFSRSGAATSITVSGTGFVASPRAACRILHATGKTTHLSSATFINSTTVVCQHTAGFLPSYPPAQLAYTHDAYIYGTSMVPFAVVGDSAGLRVVSPAAGTSFVSAGNAIVPDVAVHVVDINQNSVFHLDPFNRKVECTATKSLADNATVTVYTAGGATTFASLLLAAPRVGPVRLTFQTTTRTTTPWTASVLLDITVGAPTRLLIDNGNSTTVWVYGAATKLTLDPMPILFVTDDAGNKITEESRIPLTLGLTYPTQELVAGTVVSSSNRLTAGHNKGVYTFRSVGVQGLHGNAYNLLFTPVSAAHIAQLTYEGIGVVKCVDKEEYAVQDTAACKACPANGICDGTTVVKNVDGFWRSRQSSYVFYDCGAPFSADSCTTGLSCARGYTGPRCSVCERGYGRTGRACDRCNDPAVNYTILALVLLVALGVVYFLVTNSIKAGETAKDATNIDILPLVFKMLVNHVQMASITGVTNSKAPRVVVSFFTGAGSASTINPNFAFAACEVTTNEFRKFVVVALSPFCMIAFFAVVQAVRIAVRRHDKREHVEIMYAEDAELNRRDLLDEGDFPHDAFDVLMEDSDDPDNDDDSVASIPLDESGILGVKSEAEFTNAFGSPVSLGSDAKLRTGRLQAKATSKPREWVNFVAVTLIVVLFIVFPTVLELSGNMLKCEELDYGTRDGRPVSHRVLFADRSIDCDSPEYATYRDVAFVHLFAYGFGLPLLVVVTVKLIAATTMNGNMGNAKKHFYFMTGGFEPSRWYWEAVGLTRKAVVVLIAFGVDSNEMRVYLSIWTMFVAITLNLVAKPYAVQKLSALEMASMLCIAGSLNLGLLFGRDEFDPDTSPGLFWCVVVVILGINVAMLAVFAFMIGVASRAKVVSVADANPHRWGFVRDWMRPAMATLETRTEMLTRKRDRTLQAILDTQNRGEALAEACNVLLSCSGDRATVTLITQYRTFLSLACPRPRYACPDDVALIMALEREIMRKWHAHEKLMAALKPAEFQLRRPAPTAPLTARGVGVPAEAAVVAAVRNPLTPQTAPRDAAM
jgi:hypothetical protein